jgi:dihydrofolate reductase
MVDGSDGRAATFALAFRLVRRLIEITFMSLDGVIDSPEVVKEGQRYFSAPDEQQYELDHLFAADALLLGRKTYENFSKAYTEMAKSGQGAPAELVARMNSIPKFVASHTLQDASWNATIIRGDLATEVRKLKNQPGKDIIKYGTGSVDRVLLAERLVDQLCIIVYPFVLGAGHHLLEGADVTAHFQLSDSKRMKSGAMILEYSSAR